MSAADVSRATALSALAAKQRSILVAVRAAMSNSAASGRTYVVVDYDLSGDAGDTLVDEGFTVTSGGSGTYEVDWTP